MGHRPVFLIIIGRQTCGKKEPPSHFDSAMVEAAQQIARPERSDPHRPTQNSLLKSFIIYHTSKKNN